MPLLRLGQLPQTEEKLLQEEEQELSSQRSEGGDSEESEEVVWVRDQAVEDEEDDREDNFLRVRTLFLIHRAQVLKAPPEQPAARIRCMRLPELPREATAAHGRTTARPAKKEPSPPNVNMSTLLGEWITAWNGKENKTVVTLPPSGTAGPEQLEVTCHRAYGEPITLTLKRGPDRSLRCGSFSLVSSSKDKLSWTGFGKCAGQTSEWRRGEVVAVPAEEVHKRIAGILEKASVPMDVCTLGSHLQWPRLKTQHGPLLDFLSTFPEQYTLVLKPGAGGRLVALAGQLPQMELERCVLPKPSLPTEEVERLLVEALKTEGQMLIGALSVRTGWRCFKDQHGPLQAFMEQRPTIFQIIRDSLPPKNEVRLIGDLGAAKLLGDCAGESTSRGSSLGTKSRASASSLELGVDARDIAVVAPEAFDMAPEAPPVQTAPMPVLKRHNKIPKALPA